jgi:A/G-specific adenine glycosylase
MEAFRKLIYDYFALHGRALPWRATCDPYHIFVSEIMLQQTQVDRVVLKYTPFIRTFPDFRSLALAPFQDVLGMWQGLGYNRRALALTRAAQRVVDEFGSALPSDPDALATLPGVGKTTACSIAAFAFNMPVVFVETNVRTVFIHFFFGGREMVSDAEILPLVDEALDRREPRRWYSALMDYGTMLKKAGRKDHRKSTGYKKQSPFRGSDRQLRGQILKALLAQNGLSQLALSAMLAADGERVRRIVDGLLNEGMLTSPGDDKVYI